MNDCMFVSGGLLAGGDWQTEIGSPGAAGGPEQDGTGSPSQRKEPSELSSSKVWR